MARTQNYLEKARAAMAAARERQAERGQGGVVTVGEDLTRMSVSGPYGDKSDESDKKGGSLQPGPPKKPGRRDFLSRPLGQEEEPAPWVAWAPLMTWLLERHPDHYHRICEAEEAIRALERRGVVEGEEHERACKTLLMRFEAARRLKLSEGFKIWFQ